MSRRSGQLGHIEPSGKWWVVRWWMDVPGQEKRAHNRARSMPDLWAGSLSKSARQSTPCPRDNRGKWRRYRRVNFNWQVVRRTQATTFRERAAKWVEESRERNRKPVRSGTLDDWERTLGKWIYPVVGDLPLSEVGNAAMKQLVAKMVKGGLQPKTITTYAGIVKMVRASAVDEEGNQLLPIKWNHNFIDMPVVEESEQNRPSFCDEVMSGLAQYHRPREQMLFITAGAAGLRVGEALGIEIGKHLSADCSTVSIKQQARQGRVHDWLKTVYDYRQVDLSPEIAKLLRDFIGTRTSGSFPNQDWEAADTDQCPSPPFASRAQETRVCESTHWKPQSGNPRLPSFPEHVPQERN